MTRALLSFAVDWTRVFVTSQAGSSKHLLRLNLLVAGLPSVAETCKGKPSRLPQMSQVAMASHQVLA